MARIKSQWGYITTQSLAGDVWRVVESQEQIATLGLVSNLSEQHLLEQMLDDSKNTLAEEISKLDYLLFTPFRYPPLKWGSRFGKESERGIFYGSKELTTVLAEVAYYRLIFWDGMSKSPEVSITTQHTGFQVSYKMNSGVDLAQPPFDTNEYAELLTSKTDYSFTQKVGSFLRENNIDGLYFYSVRSEDGGENIALFNPATLRNKKPTNKKEIVCELNQNSVSFTISHQILGGFYQFAREVLF